MYPVYVDNSNIDESLTSDFKISEIHIKISHTIKEAYDRLEKQIEQNELTSYNRTGRQTVKNPSEHTKLISSKKIELERMKADL